MLLYAAARNGGGRTKAVVAFATSFWFQVVGIPIVLMLIGVLATGLGRRDGDDSPRLNDWAVGTTLLLMVLGTILGDIGTAKAQLPVLVVWLIGVLFTVFLSLTYDRYYSWERDQTTGRPGNRKRLLVGVIVPDILCLLIFGMFQVQKVG